MWYGSIENAPQTVDKRSSGAAGKFRVTSGAATGTTGMSVYASPDPSTLIFLLSMMPYNTVEMNETRVGFVDADTKVDSAAVERFWYDAADGTSREALLQGRLW